MFKDNGQVGSDKNLSKWLRKVGKLVKHENNGVKGLDKVYMYVYMCLCVCVFDEEDDEKNDMVGWEWKGKIK